MLVVAFQNVQELLGSSGFALGEEVDPIVYSFIQLKVMVVVSRLKKKDEDLFQNFFHWDLFVFLPILLDLGSNYFHSLVYFFLFL